MTALVDSIDLYVTAKERRWITLLLCLDALLWYSLRYVRAARGRELNLAYPLVSFVATLQFVKYGFGALLDGSMAELGADSYTRLKAPDGYHHEGFDQLAQIMFAYELFNTLSSVVMPQYRTGEFLGHHILTMMIAKMSQRHGPEFYGLFYLGIASVSTLFLIFVDIFKYGPRSLRERFGGVNALCRVLFAVSFLLVRAGIWPLMNVAFWYDAAVNLRYPPEDGGTWRPYLIGLLLANTFLGALQLLWAGRIVKGLRKMLGPKKGTEEESGKKKSS